MVMARNYFPFIHHYFVNVEMDTNKQLTFEILVVCNLRRWRGGLVVSALVAGSSTLAAGCRVATVGQLLFALCSLGLGLLNPPSSRGL